MAGSLGRDECSEGALKRLEEFIDVDPGMLGVSANRRCTNASCWRETRHHCRDCNVQSGSQCLILRILCDEALSCLGAGVAPA
ncbi:hypothetical protein R6138_04553 [Ralstonia thomasii]|nr:hypothetical protein R6138_04553 [Ralstonia sp. LMG 18095]